MDFMQLSFTERRLMVDDLLARYARCIDDDQLEDWPAFFTTDCRYVLRSRENADRGLPTAAIFCDSRAMLVDRIVALRNANIFEAHRYRHFTSATVLDDITPHALTARSNYLVIRTRSNGVSEIFSTGEACDRVVVDDGALRFAERVITFDTDRIDTLLVTPL